MQSIITSYIIQKRECSLPHLGSLKFIRHHAVLDIADKQLSPPAEEIVFNESSDQLSPTLTEYVSSVENISTNEAEEKINTWCLNQRMILDNNGELVFESLGTIRTDASGKIFFKKKKGIIFYEPVKAEPVIRKDAEHTVLVGDKETTSSAMNEFYREEVPQEKDKWRIIALVAGIAAILILIFYFSTHSFSEKGISNQKTFDIKQPAPTYQYLAK